MAPVALSLLLKVLLVALLEKGGIGIDVIQESVSFLCVCVTRSLPSSSLLPLTPLFSVSFPTPCSSFSGQG